MKLLFDRQFLDYTRFLIVECEGAYSHHPSDPGGETLFGINSRDFPDMVDKLKSILESWYPRKPISQSAQSGLRFIDYVLSNKQMDWSRIDYYYGVSLTANVVSHYYLTFYVNWDFFLKEQDAPALKLLIYDGVVNLGPRGNGKCLQKVLNQLGAVLIVDGRVGPLTIAALLDTLEKRGEQVILDLLFQERYKYYRDLVDHNPKLGVFLNGWINRIKKVRGYLDENITK